MYKARSWYTIQACTCMCIHVRRCQRAAVNCGENNTRPVQWLRTPISRPFVCSHLPFVITFVSAKFSPTCALLVPAYLCMRINENGRIDYVEREREWERKKENWISVENSWGQSDFRSSFAKSGDIPSRTNVSCRTNVR